MNTSVDALAPSALVGLMTVSLVLVWFYTFWQRFVIDQTRQRLFELRDQWFDVCADAEILTTPAARFIRELLNGQIRFAHRMTAPTVLWYLAVARNRNAERAVTAAREAALRNLPEQLRAQASSILQSASWQVIAGMARRSLLTTFAVLLAGGLFIALAPAAAFQYRVRKSIVKAMDSELALTAAEDPEISRLVALTC
jgi:hypothetical protein